MDKPALDAIVHQMATNPDSVDRLTDPEKTALLSHIGVDITDMHRQYQSGIKDENLECVLRYLDAHPEYLPMLSEDERHAILSYLCPGSDPEKIKRTIGAILSA
jgi:hypothetical protein